MQLPLTGAEPVDALLEAFPAGQRWLGDRNVLCTQCGEVFWGSLRELAEYRGIRGEAFDALLAELSEFLSAPAAGRDD
jgi:hypothetical protein